MSGHDELLLDITPLNSFTLTLLMRKNRFIYCLLILCCVHLINTLSSMADGTWLTCSLSTCKDMSTSLILKWPDVIVISPMPQGNRENQNHLTSPSQRDQRQTTWRGRRQENENFCISFHMSVGDISCIVTLTSCLPKFDIERQNGYLIAVRKPLKTWVFRRSLVF